MTQPIKVVHTPIHAEAMQFKGGSENAAELVYWAKLKKATATYHPGSKGTGSAAKPSHPQQMRVGQPIAGSTKSNVLTLDIGDWLVLQGGKFLHVPGITFSKDWSFNEREHAHVMGGLTAEEQRELDETGELVFTERPSVFEDGDSTLEDGMKAIKDAEARAFIESRPIGGAGIDPEADYELETYDAADDPMSTTGGLTENPLPSELEGLRGMPAITDDDLRALNEQERLEQDDAEFDELRKGGNDGSE